MKEEILIVEDDVDISGLLKRILEDAGYETKQAYSGTEALLCCEKKQPDLIMLDLMLPGMTGEELLLTLREGGCDIPVLVLSARSSLQDKVTLLKEGADDYITKPFEPEEVLVRVMAAFRRCGSPGAGTESERYTYKDLILDQASRTVTVKQREISLTRYEYEILCILIQQPRKVFSRESLYEQVWKNGYYGEDNTVNVHVSNIRKKIAAIDPEAEYIRTVWGIGFKMA